MPDLESEFHQLDKDCEIERSETATHQNYYAQTDQFKPVFTKGLSKMISLKMR